MFYSSCVASLFLGRKIIENGNGGIASHKSVHDQPESLKKICRFFVDSRCPKSLFQISLLIASDARTRLVSQVSETVTTFEN